MKKKNTILFFTIFLLSLLLYSCSPAPQDDKEQNEENLPTATSVSDKAKKNKVSDIDIRNTSLLLSSTNRRTVTSDSITIEQSDVSQCMETEQLLRQEADYGIYSFDDPLIVVNPFHNSPLTAVMIFTTEEKYSVNVTVKGDPYTLGGVSEQEAESLNDISGHVDAAYNHYIPIVGLYPGRSNDVLIELMDESGKVAVSKTFSIETEALPDKLKDAVRVKENTAVSSLALTYVSGQGTPYAFAYDRSGTIRWYISTATASYGIFPLSDGRFIFQVKGILCETLEKPHTVIMYEMDQLGRIYNTYYVENGYHHEVKEKVPGGNLLALSNSIEKYVEDSVVEIDRNTGEVVKRLDMYDIFGDVYNDMIDWAHLNTVSYLEDEDCIVLCPRNLHSGIKVNWSTDELVWILCNPEFWKNTKFEEYVLKPTGDIRWHYQPHTIYQIAEDTDNNPATKHIMMFDNHAVGTRKVDFFDKVYKSNVTLYTIDEKSMTVKQEKLYSGPRSGITSNFVLDYANKRVYSMGGNLVTVIDERHGFIQEFDYDTCEALNSYTLLNSFYRAEPVKLDFNMLSKPISYPENYAKGRLQAPTVISEAVSELKIKSDTSSLSGISYTITDDILYVKCKDHSIEQLAFINPSHNYGYDLTYTKGSDEYKNVSYKIAIPLQHMEGGDYKIIIRRKGNWFESGKSFTIK